MLRMERFSGTTPGPLSYDGGLRGGGLDSSTDPMDDELTEVRSLLNGVTPLEYRDDRYDRYCSAGDAREDANDRRENGPFAWAEGAQDAPGL